MPARLLDALLAIERDAGRERPYADAARTLDLDLILFGDAIIDEPGLTVPHPRFRERRFVLEPLAEIAPDLQGSGDRPDDRGAAGGAASVKKAESSEAFPPPPPPLVRFAGAAPVVERKRTLEADEDQVGAITSNSVIALRTAARIRRCR